MQTIEVTFQKNYHTSFEDRFLMETLIIKVSADTVGEDAQILWDKARQEAELNHKRNNPHLFPPDIPKREDNIYPKYFTEPNLYDNGSIFKEPTLEEQINSCTDAAILTKTYKFIVKGKPELETIYNNKLKELQP